MSSNAVLGKLIGFYGEELQNAPFGARAANIPNTVPSRKKLQWDAGVFEHVLFTNKGTFLAPQLKEVKPSSFDVDSIEERTHVFHPVTFSVDIDILGILVVDMENQEVVAPCSSTFPIMIRDSSVVSLAFKFPYFIRGSRK